MRSSPQVIGAAHDAIRWAREQVETELNGVCDNPIFLPDDGITLTGLVKDEGASLRILNPYGKSGADIKVDKTKIESRALCKISLMPEGQEATLSRREFVDLIAYLQTLK